METQSDCNYMSAFSYNSSGWNTHKSLLVKNFMISNNIPIGAIQ